MGGPISNGATSANMTCLPDIVLKQRRWKMSLIQGIFAFSVVCIGMMTLTGYTAYRSGVSLLGEMGTFDGSRINLDIDWNNLRNTLHKDLMDIRRTALSADPGTDFQSKETISYFDRLDAAIVAGQSHPRLLAIVVNGRTTHACPTTLIDQVSRIHLRPDHARIDFESCRSGPNSSLSACLKFRGFPFSSAYLSTLSWHGLQVRCGRYDG